MWEWEKGRANMKIHKEKQKQRLCGISVFGVVCIIFLLCIQIPTKAEGEKKIIRVADCNFDGYFTGSEEEGYSGYGYEYLQEIAKYTGWEYQFIEASWEESLKMLEAGELDLLGMAQYTEERNQIFDYCDYPIGTECTLLLIHNNNDSIYYDDYESFNGSRIGALKDSFQITLLEELGKEKEFTFELVLYDDYQDIEEALTNKEIDIMLSESLQHNNDLKVVARFSPRSYYFMSQKGNDNLMKELNDALDKIQSTDIKYNYKLFEKYYSSNEINQLAFTRKEAEFIDQHKTLRVAYNSGWNPVSYTDKKSGEFKGIYSQIMNLFAKEYDLHFEYVPVFSADSALELLNSGQIDIICGMSPYYEDAKDDIILTKTFLEIPVTLSKRIDTDIRNIHKIAVPANCVMLESYLKQMNPTLEIIKFDNTERCLEAVHDGRVDAMYENIYVLNQFANMRRYSEIEPIVSMQTEIPMCFGMQKNEDTILYEVFNKMISQLLIKEVNNIIIESTISPPYFPLEVLLIQYFVPFVMVGCILLFLFLIFSKIKIQKYAFVDSLTKCNNETKFLLLTEKLIKSKNAKDYAIVSLDIDHFKMINNMCNFETGNKLLCELVNILKKELSEDEFFCRKSDDHFLLCINKSNKEKMDSRGYVVIEKISNILKREQIDFQYAVSCGICFLEDASFDIHVAIGWASMARKKAKTIKNNSIIYYDSTMQEQAVREQEIVNNMEYALKNGEFQVYLQPQVSVISEKIVGAEALARWIRKDGSMIYPDEFIPIFEKNGFIKKLDLYIFEKVCKKIKEWIEQGKDVFRISVNVSRIHLSDPNFYKEYIRIMEKYEIPSNKIELELTESTIFENKEQMITLILILQNAGIFIAMDDFGSGYSSLNLLKDLAVDFLKLDKEFFNASTDSQRGQDVIKSVVEMAEKLKMNVVAEGVETIEQVKFLKEIGCGIIQGYYYYRPMDIEHFEEIL